MNPAQHPVDTASPEVKAARERLNLPRNKPCPCGSGKKYKMCCLPKDEAIVEETKFYETIEKSPKDVLAAVIAHPEQLLAPRGEVPLFALNSEPAGQPAEVDVELANLWNAFQGLRHPTTVEMNVLLERLLQLPPEATVWNEVFTTFANHGHEDLPGLFRRIVTSVPHTKKTAMAYFYWAACEQFNCPQFRHLLPEVAKEMLRVHGKSCDSVALSFIISYLLANGLDAEAQMLLEHFIPFLRKQKDLFSWVVGAKCQNLFEIRAGRLLTKRLEAGVSLENQARELLRGLEKDIHPQAAMTAVEMAAGLTPMNPVTKAQFDLPPVTVEDEDAGPEDSEEFLEETAEVLNAFDEAVLKAANETLDEKVEPEESEDDEAEVAANEEKRPIQEPTAMTPASVQQLRNMLFIVREMHAEEKFSPGCAYPALMGLMSAIYMQKQEESPKEVIGNLFDVAVPHGIERRIKGATRTLTGLDMPAALLMLKAHRMVLHFGLRHGLVGAEEGAKTERELDRLKEKICPA